MSDEKKISPDELEGLIEEQEGQSVFSLQNLFTMFVLNWQWFLLSLFIFVCGALLYLRYATPTYQVSAKVLIKDEPNKRRNSGQMLANMQEFGFLSTSEGIMNEIEILQSGILARDAVLNLKLYTEYKLGGRIKNVLVYKYQPVNVDLDATHLQEFDTELLNGTRQIKMEITKGDSGYRVEGETWLNDHAVASFEKTVSALPDTISTSYGTLTLTANQLVANKKNDSFENGAPLYVTILPPMAVARSYVKSLTIEPSSKQTTIA